MSSFHSLMVALAALSTPRVPTGHTIYVAQVNGHTAVCAVAQRDKACYNLLSCEDSESYFCVQNVEMKADK